MRFGRPGKTAWRARQVSDDHLLPGGFLPAVWRPGGECYPYTPQNPRREIGGGFAFRARRNRRPNHLVMADYAGFLEGVRLRLDEEAAYRDTSSVTDTEGRD